MEISTLHFAAFCSDALDFCDGVHSILIAHKVAD